MINRKLRAAREKKHWSMETAAEKIGVSKTSIARWENGEQKPRGASLDLVCTTYGMSAEELGLVDTEKGIIAFSSQSNTTNNQSSLQIFEKDVQNPSFGKIERRSFLHTIISDACIALFLPTLALRAFHPPVFSSMWDERRVPYGARWELGHTT